MWGLPTNFLLHTLLQLTKCATWKAQWGPPGPTTLHGGFLEMQEGGEKKCRVDTAQSSEIRLQI